MNNSDFWGELDHMSAKCVTLVIGSEDYCKPKYFFSDTFLSI